MLAFGTQIRRFTPGRSRRIFRAKKSSARPPSSPIGGEVKPSVPCRSFTACKRSVNGVGVVISAKLPDSSTFRRWVLSRGDRRGDSWWRKLDRTISLKPAVRSCTNKQTNLIIRRRCVKCGYFQNCCTSRRVQRGGTMLGMDRVLFVI